MVIGHRNVLVLNKSDVLTRITVRKGPPKRQRENRQKDTRSLKVGTALRR